jgi:4-aminobutyrate aminotransferase
VDAVSGFEARARRVLPPVLGHYTWLSIDRGEGSWLYTTDRRRILDLTCGIAVTVVGHAHPRVVKAVTDQVSRLMHISTGVAKYESSVALAEALATVAPNGLDTVFFGNSGAEAVEGAIKLARQTTGREAIIAFRGGFHGRTTGAATLTTSKAQYKRGYGALLPEVYVAPFPYPLA